MTCSIEEAELAASVTLQELIRSYSDPVVVVVILALASSMAHAMISVKVEEKK